MCTVLCAVHDVGHPARMNPFLVTTMHPSIVPYLSRGGGVLETMHAAIFSKLLRQPGQTVLELMTPVDRQLARETILELVLSTDLSKQGDIMSKWLEKKQPDSDSTTAGMVPGWNVDFTVGADRRQFLKIVLKAADVSNPAKPLSLYLFWTNRILQEFYDQGDEEARLGMPVTSMPQCDRSTPSVPSGQKGFVSFVVKPVFESLSGFSAAVLTSKCLSVGASEVEGLSDLMGHINSNLQFWNTVCSFCFFKIKNVRAVHVFCVCTLPFNGIALLLFVQIEQKVPADFLGRVCLPSDLPPPYNVVPPPASIDAPAPSPPPEPTRSKKVPPPKKTPPSSKRPTLEVVEPDPEFDDEFQTVGPDESKRELADPSIDEEWTTVGPSKGTSI